MENAIFEQLEQLARDLGAFKAKVIPTKDVPTDASFRTLCEKNTCHSYGMNYGCPPDVGTVEEVLEALYSYQCILVYQYVGELEDSFDFEGMTAAGDRHRALVYRFRDEADAGITLPRRLYLGAGGCRYCKTCARVTNEPCRFPEKRIASLESYCVNVSQLAKAADMKYINGQNTVTYFGGMLFDLQ